MCPMEISSMDDYGTRQRQAFRAGWVAALRNEPHVTPHQNDADLEARWSQGFRDGARLRQTWKTKKAMRSI